MKDQSYGSQEKLKSKRIIADLFNKGQVLFTYPVKLVYLPLGEDESGDSHLFAVSVSKKRFKKAVDRNRIKRLLRECYRHNKHLIGEVPPHALMAIYIANDLLTYDEIEKSMKKILMTLRKKQMKG